MRKCWQMWAQWRTSWENYCGRFGVSWLNSRLRCSESYTQLAVTPHDIPALRDLAVFDHERLLVQRHRRAHMCRHGVDHIARFELIGIPALNHEMFFILQ